MKQRIFILLLLIFCSLKPAAHNPCLDGSNNILAAHRYLIWYGLMRIVEASALHNAHVPLMVEQAPEQQIHIMHRRDSVRKKQTSQQKQYCQINKINNRIDRQSHARVNMQLKQPKQRNQKRLAKSYQRL